MRKPIFLILLGLGLLAGATAHATVVVPADLKQLTTRANAIVRGRVVTVQSQWTGDGRRVETIVTLEASGYIKGDLGPRVIFRVPGGKMGTLRSVVVGAPVVREGDEIIVFLGATGPAIPRIVGFNQGIFRVAIDAASGRRVVAKPVLAGEPASKTPFRAGDVTVKTVPLSEFEGQVRSLVAQDVARPGRNAPAGRAVPRIR
jgi:hypothetical protein